MEMVGAVHMEKVSVLTLLKESYLNVNDLMK